VHGRRLFFVQASSASQQQWACQTQKPLFFSDFDDGGSFDREACFADIGRRRRAGEVSFARIEMSCGRDVGAEPGRINIVAIRLGQRG
jgi:hypothetical protein